MNPGLEASIRDRLLNLARARGDDFNLILNRYALERWLYRLSVSSAQDRLWLKGAMLFDLWFDYPHRPTRDADFLGFGDIDADTLAATVGEICDVPCNDGMDFDRSSVRVDDIRDEARYPAATFGRRGTRIPDTWPMGLTSEFSDDRTKQGQWRAFLGRNSLSERSLTEVVETLRGFAAQPLELARRKSGG